MCVFVFLWDVFGTYGGRGNARMPKNNQGRRHGSWLATFAFWLLKMYGHQAEFRLGETLEKSMGKEWLCFMPQIRVTLGLMLGLTLFIVVGSVPAARVTASAPVEWQSEVLYSRSFVGPHTAIQVDNLGHNHIIFVDNSTRTLLYTVWEGVESGWKLKTVAHSKSQDCCLFLDELDLALSYAGVPQIAFRDLLTIYYAVPGTSGAFTTEVVGQGSDPSIAYAEGGPRIAYIFNYSNVIYAQRIGGVWNQETLPLNNDMRESPSLKVDSYLHPHIAFQEDVGGVTQIRYAYWDGTAWQIQNVANGERPSLALDSQNRPHIAFRDGFKVFHAYLDNSTWVIQTVATYTAKKIGAPVLALDASDVPHLVYVFGGGFEGSFGDLYYGYWDGTAWQVQNLGDVARTTSIFLNVHPGFAVDSAGTPHVTFTTSFNGDLYHTSQGPDWRTSQVDFGTTIGNTSLEADWNGNPYVSYASLNGATRGLNYALLQSYCSPPTCNTTWAKTTVAPGEGGDRGLYNSLAMRSLVDGGEARIASYNPVSQDLEYSYQVGTDWHTETVDSSGDVGKYSSLALAENGEPHVAYWDNTHTVVKFGWKDPSGWHLLPDSAAPALDANSGSLSLALTPSNSPYCCRDYISYYDAVHGDLRLAMWDGTAWSDKLIDDGSETNLDADVGRLNSLAYSPKNNQLAIAYYDATNQALKIAEGITETWTITTAIPNTGPMLDLSELSEDEFIAEHRIAYTTETDNALHVAYKTYSQGSWVDTIVASGGSFPRRYVSLAASGNRLHVIYRNGQNDELVYAQSTSTVKTINYNPLQPCTDRPEQSAAVRYKDAALHPFSVRVPSAAPMSDLDILRGLRDLFATDPDGQHYIDLYYEHAAETGAIGIKDPSLMLDTYSTLQKFLPGFEALIAGHGDELVIGQELIDATNNIFDRIVAAGSPALGEAIEQERGKFHHLQDFVGLSFAQSSNLVGVPAPTICTSRPVKPKLVSPRNGAVETKRHVHLDWNATPCASQYQVTVKQDSKHGPVVDRRKGLTLTEIKTKKLVRGHTYFWKVKGCNSFGCRASKWRSFRLN